MSFCLDQLKWHGIETGRHDSFFRFVSPLPRRTESLPREEGVNGPPLWDTEMPRLPMFSLVLLPSRIPAEQPHRVLLVDCVRRPYE